MDEHVHHADVEKRFLERYVDGSSGSTAALAPHGGTVEPHTDDQALAYAGRVDCPAWLCQGYVRDGGAFGEWHVTSTEIDPTDYEYLARLYPDGVEVAVSFHGFRGDGILVGGGIERRHKRELASRLRASIDSSVEVVSPGNPYAGTDSANVVNRVSRRGGIQLEEGVRVRSELGATVVDVVASFVIELVDRP